jgi:hypothetical protein
MTLCPRGCGRPSRHPQRPHGRVPYCAACFAETRRANWARCKREGPKRLQLRRGPDPDDLSPAEIERRYQAALATIRTQAVRP